MFPKINDLVYIQVASATKKDAEKECKSRIADIEDESFLIEVPIESETGRIKRLFLGDELSIYFITDSGVKNYFNTYVLGFVDDVVQLVRIRKPSEDSISKIQRRSFLRVSTGLEIAVKLRDNTRFVTVTEDVGGGGASFICDGNLPIAEGELVYCWLLVPFKNGLIDHIPFEAEVVRTKKLESGRKIVMLKFISISNLERQTLIRYCFERQLDSKKK